MAELPGFHGSECWKCRGTGRQDKVGGRSARRAAEQAKVGGSVVALATPGVCCVCEGSGALQGSSKRERGKEVPGCVTPQRSSHGVGPRPFGDGGCAELEPACGEALCCLAGAWRIFQNVGAPPAGVPHYPYRFGFFFLLLFSFFSRSGNSCRAPISWLAGGHRYSTEDVVTSHCCATHLASALAERAGTVRHVDLGTGVGSVLMLTAWRAVQTPGATSYSALGLEAQKDSLALARRSLRYNGIADTAEILEGDLRALATDPALVERLLRCDAHDDDAVLVVTGTPPYFDVNLGADGVARTKDGAFPQCEQSAGARYEFRGGIEVYAAAGAALLARWEKLGRRSLFVCCEGGLHVNLRRVELAADAAGLRIARHLPVVGREGKPPLFGVWVFELKTSTAKHAPSDAPIVVRDANGDRTPRYSHLLDEMGMTP